VGIEYRHSVGKQVASRHDGGPGGGEHVGSMMQWVGGVLKYGGWETVGFIHLWGGGSHHDDLHILL
jgi:hypothetical protein